MTSLPCPPQLYSSRERKTQLVPGEPKLTWSFLPLSWEKLHPYPLSVIRHTQLYGCCNRNTGQGKYYVILRISFYPLHILGGIYYQYIFLTFFSIIKKTNFVNSWLKNNFREGYNIHRYFKISMCPRTYVYST